MKQNRKTLIAILLAVSMMTGCGTDSAGSENQSIAAASSEIITSLWVAGEDGSEIPDEENSENTTSNADTALTADDLTLVTFIPDDQPEATDDFYSYVNYDKARSVCATDGLTSYSAFTALDETVNEQLSTMVTDISNLTKEPKEGSCRQKIKDLYACALDSTSRSIDIKEKMDDLLENVMKAADIQTYVNASARLYKTYHLGGCMTITPGINSQDTSTYQADINRLSLVLPDTYYTDDAYAAYQTRYLDLITALFSDYGYEESEAQSKAQQVYDFQKTMAEALQSAEAESNKTAQADELSSVFTTIDTKEWLKAAGCEDISFLNVLSLSQAKALNEYLKEDNLQTLKDYTLFICMYDTAAYASTDIRDQVLTFENSLNGVNTIPTEEDLALSVVKELLPWEVSKLYVKNYFPAESKAYVTSVTDEITETYKTLIKNKTDITPAAKNKAIDKLNQLSVKVGYPADFDDYLSEASVQSPDEGASLWDNMLALKKAAAKKSAARFGNDHDRDVWELTPFTVNAYYNASENELVIPAAILQEPFYSASYAKEQILGGIGFVAAHEITHVFDETGSAYDEKGNYNSWWSDTEKEKYADLKKKVAAYYSKFKLLDGENVDGERTASEDIADLSALECLSGMVSNENGQLSSMFEQFAACWIKITTKASFQYALANDANAPAKVRVNAPLRCLNAFYKAYKVTEKNDMYLSEKDRITVW